MRARAAAGLATFLAPRSIAVSGASPEKRKIRGALLHVLRGCGFAGKIFPVNPSYREIDGLACYPDAAAIGAEVDLALICIPAPAVLPALEACSDAGVGNAVIISSGFAEGEAAAAEELQHRIAEFARRSGMRICGPNAEGFHNEVAKVSATFSPAIEALANAGAVACTKRVGVVAQSGGIGFALYNRGRSLGLAFSSVISTGNEADLTAADFFEHLAADAETSGVLLFLESIRDPARFRSAAQTAARAGKPVVVLKAGRSLAGRQASQSHTASLAGWEAGYDAFFRHCGIAVAADLDEALCVIAALATNPRARGRHVAILTASGGAGALAADVLTKAGLDVAELSGKTQARLRGFIPAYGAARNPVDITAQGAYEGGALRAAELLLADAAVDMLAIVTSLANPTRVTLDPRQLFELAERARKPLLVHSYAIPSELGRGSMALAGIVLMPSLTLLGLAARALAETSPATDAAWQRSSAQAPLDQLGEAGAMTEFATKRLLAECGIAVPPARLVARASELERAAAELGFPLALKIQSPDIPHKSEAGGVRLGVADGAALIEAYRAVIEAARRFAPSARIDGVSLEPMAAPGIEIIIGAVDDPTVGPVVTIGAGGVATELYGDCVQRLAPISEPEARAMLSELRIHPMLEGFRAAPPADLGAVARLAADVSRLAAAGVGRIAELELNPVIVHPQGQGCTIADALLVVAPQAEAGARKGA